MWTPRYETEGAGLLARNLMRCILRDSPEAMSWAGVSFDEWKITGTAHAGQAYTKFPVLLVFPMVSPESRQQSDGEGVEFTHRLGVEFYLTGKDQEVLSEETARYLRALTEIVWAMSEPDWLEGADRERFGPLSVEIDNIDFDATRSGGTKYLRIPSFEVNINCLEARDE